VMDVLAQHLAARAGEDVANEEYSHSSG
jgi:hypothetical protein